MEQRLCRQPVPRPDVLKATGAWIQVRPVASVRRSVSHNQEPTLPSQLFIITMQLTSTLGPLLFHDRIKLTWSPLSITVIRRPVYYLPPLYSVDVNSFDCANVASEDCLANLEVAIRLRWSLICIYPPDLRASNWTFARPDGNRWP